MACTWDNDCTWNLRSWNCRAEIYFQNMKTDSDSTRGLRAGGTLLLKGLTKTERKVVAEPRVIICTMMFVNSLFSWNDGEVRVWFVKPNSIFRMVVFHFTHTHSMIISNWKYHFQQILLFSIVNHKQIVRQIFFNFFHLC